MKTAFQATAISLFLIALQGCEKIDSPKNAPSAENTLPNEIGPTKRTSNLYLGRVTHQYSNRDVHNIFTIEEDGTELVQITFSPANKEHDNLAPAVSPDGTRIAFMTSRHRNDPNNGNTSEIYVMNIDGSNQIRLSSNNGIDDDDPRWCSNDRLIYSSNSNLIEIDAADLNNDGKGDNPATVIAAIDNYYNYSADCSTSNIVFIRDPGKYVVIADRNGGNQMTLAGGGSMANSQPRFSQNGLRIVYGSSISSLSTGTQDIYTMDAADLNNDQQGDNRQRITTSSYGAGSFNPTWSPTADQIAYSRHTGDNYEIRKIEISTGEDSIVVTAPPNGFVGDWQ